MDEPAAPKAVDHKQELIRNMLDLYKNLPFVPIADSGQHDPEIYRQIVDEHPGRVLAVYIRNAAQCRGRTEAAPRSAAGRFAGSGPGVAGHGRPT